MLKPGDTSGEIIQWISGHRVISLLGEGGMARVYKVLTPSGTYQALKITRRDTPAQVERLYKERRALARLSHPGIVSMLNAGHHQGRPWYTMEAIEGQNIAQWADDLRGQNPTLTDADGAPSGWLMTVLQAMSALCRALDHAHRKGVVHRDLKPDNILMKDEEPIIIDFGLVTCFAGAGLRASLDVDPDAVGSAAYMAPEQIRGESADPRADLYALGALMTRCLTGSIPFKGRSLRQTLRAQVRGEMPSALDSLAIPEPLKELIHRLMTPEKEGRLPYATDIAERLGQLLGESATRERRGAMSHLLLPPLIGRESLVRELLQESVKGDGRCLWLLGEGGSGKTSVLNSVSVGLERRGLRVLKAAGRREMIGQSMGMSRSLSGLHCIIAATLEETRSIPAGDPQRAEALLLWGHLSPLLDEGEPPQAAPPNPPHELPAGKLFRLLTGALNLLARSRPLVVILDDLQWMDERSLSFLAWLGRSERESHSRWSLLCGARGGDELPSAITHTLSRSDTQSWQCPPLGLEEVQTLIQLALGPEADPKSKAPELLRATGGLPLFVIETLRLRAWERRQNKDAIASPWHIPPTPAHLWTQRFGALSPSCQALLWSAAAMARPTPFELLRSLSGLSQASMALAITELKQSGILEEISEGHRLTHKRLSDAAYATIPPKKRAALHLKIARRLEAKALPTWPLELGWHLEEGGDHEAARRAYQAGAEAGIHRNEHQWMERSYRGILRLSAQHSKERIEAAMALSRRVLEPQGRLSEAQDLLSAALEDIHKRGPASMEGRVGESLGWVLLLQGQNKKAEAHIRAALAIAESQGDRLLRCRSLNKLAAVIGDVESIEASMGIYEEALGEAQALGLKQTQAHILGNLALGHLNLGQLRSAIEISGRAQALARDIKDVQSENLALSITAAAKYHCGERAEALRILEEALVRLESSQSKAAQCVVRVLLGGHRLGQGRPDLALPMLLEAKSSLESQGLTFYVAHSGLILAQVFRLAYNDIPQAERYCAESLALFHQHQFPYWATLAKLEMAHIKLSNGAPIEADIDELREAMRGGVDNDSGALAQSIDALLRAAACPAPLRGQHPEDLPAGLRDYILKQDRPFQNEAFTRAASL